MNTRIRVLLVIAHVTKSLSFESLFAELDTKNHEYHFILLNPSDSELEQVLRRQGYPVIRIYMQSKLDLLGVVFQLLYYFIKIKPHVLHAQLLYANITAIPLAWLLGIRKRIYTRHFSTLHWDYHPSFVKWDKLINRLSTHIIAVSPIVKEVLTERERVPLNKVSYIPNSFGITKFQDVSPDRVQALRVKYNIPIDTIIIGTISRFIEWKGVQYVIDAVESILDRFPRICLVLANAHGSYAPVLHAKLNKQLPGKFLLITFEADVPALYRLFDMFVHVPIDRTSEAFGQTYCEALAVGVPSIFTLSGIAPAFVKDGENCLVVTYKSSVSIADALVSLIDSPGLRLKLADEGRKVKAGFDPKSVAQLHESLYK